MDELNAKLTAHQEQLRIKREQIKANVRSVESLQAQVRLRGCGPHSKLKQSPAALRARHDVCLPRVAARHRRRPWW